MARHTSAITPGSVSAAASAAQSGSNGDLAKWVSQGITRPEWQALAPELTPHLTLCLHSCSLDLINGYSILLASPHLTLEFTPVSYNPQSLFEMMAASRELDITYLFLSLPADAKPNNLGLQSPRHVSQASLLSQVPLSSSPCSTKFFKKKFDSLWGYFNFRAPVIENSKMFYGAITTPDLEGNLQVARKPKSKRQKLWGVLKCQTIYMFKKRSSACNAEYEVNLENFNELEVLDENSKEVPVSKKEPQPHQLPIGSHNVRTLALRFSNSKKSVYLTPLDRFDFKRWEESLNNILHGERRSERSVEALNALQARRISGLSNSFHNLSSTNGSRQQSPGFVRKDGKHGLNISRSSREMMASCTNLDELGGGGGGGAGGGGSGGGGCCGSGGGFSGGAGCSGLDVVSGGGGGGSHYSGAGGCSKFSPGEESITIYYQGSHAPTITVNCIPDEHNQPDSDDNDDSVALDALELLTPEEVAELKRRRISTQIQLECLIAEIKKRQMHLSPQQMQTLNAQMSDLREDIQEMSAAISRLDRDAERASAAGGSTRKKGSL